MKEQLQRSEGLSIVKKADSFVVVTPSLSVYKLNEKDFDILHLCKGVSKDMAVQEISEKYGVGREEAIRTIDKLTEKKLLFSKKAETPPMSFFPQFEWYNYHLNILNELRVPQRIWFSPIEDCNLQCPHCDVWKSNEYMSISDVEKTIGRISEYSSRNPAIWITGGEPLLKPDVLLKVLTTAREQWQYDVPAFVVKTNATLTEELKRVLDEIEGLSYPLRRVQYYHFVPQHEVRPFYPIMYQYKTPQRLRHIFFMIDLDTLYLEKDVNELPKEVEEGIGLLRKKEMPFFYSISWLGKPSEFLRLLKNLRKKIGRNKIFIKIPPRKKLADENIYSLVKALSSDLNVSFLDDMLYRVYESTIGGNFTLPKTNCGAGTREIAVDAQGNVYPCVNVTSDKNYILGNLRMASLYDVLTSDDAEEIRESIRRKIERCLRECCLTYFCAGCIFPKSKIQEKCSFAKRCLNEYLNLSLDQKVEQRYFMPGHDGYE